MKTPTIKPVIMWEGAVKDADSADVRGRAIIISHPRADEYRSRLTYSILFEVSDGTDALGVVRWSPNAGPFPEFINHVADDFLKSMKGGIS